MTTRTAKPLLTPAARPNLVEIFVDDVPVQALIDTGAQVSVMRSDLRSRLRKVLTPAESPAVRVANGSTTAVMGMCAARVTIAGRPVLVLFTVLAECPHEVILGIDFLTAHSALIDCATGTLRLELPHYFADPTEDHKSRLRSAEFVRLQPDAATYVLMSPSPPLRDGPYVVSPLCDVLLARQ